MPTASNAAVLTDGMLGTGPARAFRQRRAGGGSAPPGAGHTYRRVNS